MKLTVKWNVFTAILLAIGVFVQAQSTDATLVQKFESDTHTFKDVTLPYRLYVPEDYDETKSYPLVLCLHGAGERGIDNEIPVTKHGLATAWAKPEVQKKHPAFIVVPQCSKKHSGLKYEQYQEGEVC